ncbi:PAS domain S-box protein [Brevundimonas variabilis]|uniref:histidine kinase n=1 Tax=Brevundimonas variabilis TaxID=74312 RepID=A0A7W9FHH5_9CAUL|nr:PAS domain S-box protein [Brevundimonas variabilis]MBB5747464.1 PAS domain S-box-containing protein [Brevundimonas variabilis]
MTTIQGVTNDRLGRIVEDAASEVYVFGAEDYLFRIVNRGARDNLGYTIDELRSLTPWDIKPEISREAFVALVQPLIRGVVERLDFDTVHRRRDGTLYSVSVRLQLFEEQGDRVFYAAIQDITERQQIESDLRDVTRRLDAILDNTTMSVFLMDDRQQCVFMNKAAEQLTGYAFAETAGRPLHDVIHHSYPDGRPFPLSECAIDRAFPRNAGTQGEEVFVHKDGSFYPVAFTASPVRDERTNVVGTVVEVRDISEDRRNKEARDLLMREVDHRSRNVLAIVHSLVHLTRADDLATYKATLAGRIDALSRAQTSLASRRWEGGELRDVVRDSLDALCPGDRVACEGSQVSLSPEQVQPISMLLHELATNANKYGAFSAGDGFVSVTWRVDDGQVRLSWKETGGPQVVEPEREGFGSILKNSLMRQLRGRIDRQWTATGLAVEMTFPL